MSKTKALAVSVLMFGFITCAPLAQADTTKPVVIELPDTLPTESDMPLASWFSRWLQWVLRAELEPERTYPPIRPPSFESESIST